MIGDRMFDIDGGHACGIDTVGVLYGYGNREEFEKPARNISSAARRNS